MIEILAILLRLAGAGLITLALVHIPISKRLLWREEAGRMSSVNASIFWVHAFFICLVLVMMGLPSLIDPSIFLNRSQAGRWICFSFSSFWLIRLYFQWFVYQPELRKNKRIETFVHWFFTFIWLGLGALYAACGFVQLGRI